MSNMMKEMKKQRKEESALFSGKIGKVVHRFLSSSLVNCYMLGNSYLPGHPARLSAYWLLGQSVRATGDELGMEILFSQP